MKESAYNLCAKDPAGNLYLYNTRRGAAYVMSARAYETYWSAANPLSGPDDAARTLRDLIERGFLVEDGTDELAEIESAHSKARRSNEQLDLVIAPSMACNLDCFYCFETNRYRGVMSRETQDNIVRLVRRYVDWGTKRLIVTWYGGEPLLALSVIERLSKQILDLCAKFGREYSAEIVTNGTLLTHERAERLASWQVKRAQITLDGVPELHDRRRVARNQNPTFYRILEGIEAAAAHMQVSIRINVCRKVASRLEELLQILAARGLNLKASVYVAPLQCVQARKMSAHGSQGVSQSGISKMRGHQLDPLDGREIADLELRFYDLLSKNGFAVSNRLPELRCTTCTADKEHGWLIEANGDVQKCYWTAGLRTEAVGRLTAGGIVPRAAYRKWHDWTASRNADCLQCIMLPICLGRCPLKHLNDEFDCCPAFKCSWIYFLARAAGVADGQLVPVQLPLTRSEVDV